MPLTSARKRNASRLLLGLLFIAAGILHFLYPARYAEIIPPFLPYPIALVYISGVGEFLGGCGVLIERVRRWAGIGLIALLIAVYPANIYMLYKEWHTHGWTSLTLILLLRLPLQFLLIWWVVRASEIYPPAA